jgi:hypothetical protein
MPHQSISAGGLMRLIASIVFAVVCLCTSVAEANHIKLAILESDFAPDAQADLVPTGKFGLLAGFDVQNSTPTLAMISTYDAVLAYTNNPPFDATALGDLLADYVDAGGRVVLANYSFVGAPNYISGRIMTAGYSPLVYSGAVGPLGGQVVPINPSDPIFTGIVPANVSYYSSVNGPLPNLAAGAMLLADDGLGNNLIARNATGNVIATTFYPATASWAPGNNAEFYELMANLLDPLLVPEPSGFLLAAAGLVSLGAFRFRRRCS